MSKASRKVDRYVEKQKDIITESEIKEQFGKFSFIGKVVNGLNLFEWVGLKSINIFIMLMVYVVVTITIENYLRTITTATSAMVISHGIFTSAIIVGIFTFVKKKDPEAKPTLEEVFYRFLGLGLILTVYSLITSMFIK